MEVLNCHKHLLKFNIRTYYTETQVFPEDSVTNMIYTSVARKIAGNWQNIMSVYNL